MNNVYLAKQKIFNQKGEVVAYELLFRDHKLGIREFPSNLQATSHVILNTLTNISTRELLGEKAIAFINVDCHALTSGIVDLLDKNRFVLEILETTDLNDKVIGKIKQYHKRGFQIAIDDFDCSTQMIQKFAPILKYVHYIKMDVMVAEEENLINVMHKIKQLGIKVLAEKIETANEYKLYVRMGFDLFQGYHLHKPEVVEIDRFKDATKLVLLNLIKLIKDDAHTIEIESFIKQRVDLSFKLVKFINNEAKFETKVESITHIITLLGRDKLLRWLLLFLHSELSNNPVSESTMQIAIKRAERMEADAKPAEKDKAYIAGMFSMLDSLFETDMKVVMKGVKVDKDISDLVIDKKGKFLESFQNAVLSEREYLKQLMINNFDKLDISFISKALELSNIQIDKSRL